MASATQAENLMRAISLHYRLGYISGAGVRMRAREHFKTGILSRQQALLLIALSYTPKGSTK